MAQVPDYDPTNPRVFYWMDNNYTLKITRDLDFLAEQPLLINSLQVQAAASFLRRHRAHFVVITLVRPLSSTTIYCGADTLGQDPHEPFDAPQHPGRE